MATHRIQPTEPPDGRALRSVFGRAAAWTSRVLAVALGYGVLAVVGQSLGITAAGVSPAWPAAGLALAGCLRLGYPVMLGVVLATFAHETLRFGLPWAGALAMGLAAAAGPAFGCWLLRRYADPESPFTGVPGTVRFLVLGCAAAPAVTAILGVAVTYIARDPDVAAMPRLLAVWWVGDAIGILTVAPLILTLADGRHRRVIADHAVEFTVMLVVALGGVAAAVGANELGKGPTVHVEGLVFPVLIWAALRFDVPGAASTSAVLAASLFAGMLLGVGPHASGRLADVISLQILVGVLTTAALILAAAIRGEADAKQAKTRFLANISHELRTPLNAIIGFAELIRDRVHGDDPARYSSYAGHIHDSGTHLLELVNDVLDVSRLEQGAYRLSPEWLDPAELIAAATAMVRGDADARRVALQTDVDERLPCVYADERALRQILLNLLSNAVKFTGSGGRVEVRARSENDGLTIEVADTGCGMDPDEIPRLMKPFEHDRQRGSRNPTGTGLGLAISESLARQHDGRLEVTSAPGEGTTARVYLPANAAPAA